jgi:hypothetical protein
MLSRAHDRVTARRTSVTPPYRARSSAHAALTMVLELSPVALAA